MPRKRRAPIELPHTVEVDGERVRIYEHPKSGVIFYDIARPELRAPGGRIPHERRSLGTRDPAEALHLAEQLAARIALLKKGPRDRLRLGELEPLYLERGPRLKKSRRRDVLQVLTLIVREFGEDYPVGELGEAHAVRYVEARTSGDLVPEGGTAAGVTADTAGHELRTLFSILEWATGRRMGGRVLLEANPLAGLSFPKRSKEQRNRPVASEARYRALVAAADTVEPSGRLRLALVLAWETGRRISAILALRASDVALTPRALLRVLAEEGQDERLADIYGAAIRWRAESDKVGLRFISPMTDAARDALADYIQERGLVGEALLFPAERDSARPMEADVARQYLRRAEVEAELPHQRRGGFHAFRRAWANRVRGMPLHDAAQAGGWKSPKTLSEVYQQADPKGVNAVVKALEKRTPTHTGGDTPQDSATN